MRTITKELILTFQKHLITEEKAQATIAKYLYDIGEFAKWTGTRDINKELVLEYKSALTERYAPASVNAALASLGSLFCFCEWYDLKVKNLKIQKQIFAPTEKELTKAEYERLLQAAKQKKNERLYLLMQSICSTCIDERIDCRV